MDIKSIEVGLESRKCKTFDEAKGKTLKWCGRFGETTLLVFNDGRYIRFADVAPTVILPVTVASLGDYTREFVVEKTGLLTDEQFKFSRVAYELQETEQRLAELREAAGLPAQPQAVPIRPPWLAENLTDEQVGILWRESRGVLLYANKKGLYEIFPESLSGYGLTCKVPLTVFVVMKAHKGVDQTPIVFQTAFEADCAIGAAVRAMAQAVLGPRRVPLRPEFGGPTGVAATEKTYA